MTAEEHHDDANPEDVKRKFREALDRKNARQRDGEDHMDGDSAVHARPAPTMRREFRRKSG